MVQTVYLRSVNDKMAVMRPFSLSFKYDGYKKISLQLGLRDLELRQVTQKSALRIWR